MKLVCPPPNKNSLCFTIEVEVLQAIFYVVCDENVFWFIKLRDVQKNCTLTVPCSFQKMGEALISRKYPLVN